MKALYRKCNDGRCASSTYHKKDGTNVRAKLKHKLTRHLKKGDDQGLDYLDD